MGHRRKRLVLDEQAGQWEPMPEEQHLRPMVIVGTGSLLNDLVRTIGEHEYLKIAGILDPTPGLKGQFVGDIPILGWLGDIPRHVTTAVIGNPVHSKSFDRESVFRLLAQRGIRMPILKAEHCNCAQDVILHEGTVILPGCRIMPGASLGTNCLLGGDCRVESGACIPDHQVLSPGTTWKHVQSETDSPCEASMEAALASETETIAAIMKRINISSLEIVLVTNSAGELMGTITDGDIRRGILAGIETTQPVSLIMNPRPKSAFIGTSRSEMLAVMRDKSIRHMPIVDAMNRPVALERLETLVDGITGYNAVVMAGGLGSRLKPMTDSVPKPLVPVAGKPIIDHILTRLGAEGIGDVVLSLNHMGDMIRDHIGNGQQYGTNVSYLSERKRLGTAGALSLLRPRPRHPFLVMNGDLMTNLSFSRLLKFQRDNECDMVVCVRQMSTKIPYGVVEVNGERVSGIREKPVLKHFINAGIYVLTPSCLELVPGDVYFDMPDLVTALLQRGLLVGAFPVIEYWRDIGTPADLAAASAEQKSIDNGIEYALMTGKEQ